MPDQLHLPDTKPPADNDTRDAERAEYLERLREKLKDPDFRVIEGFPIDDDDVILAFSDLPYYTACPNPFLPEIIERWQIERAQLRADSVVSAIFITCDSSRHYKQNGFLRRQNENLSF